VSEQPPAPAERPSGLGEFVALMALTMSMVALSIDLMLPAFPEMIRDLGFATPNDAQLIISWLFIGLAVGQPFYGPLSDSVGRKPAMYAGFALLVLGSLICLSATNVTGMLAGRFLQGFGAAGPRSVAMALIRDRFQGSEMARVMSFIMTIFILVPILAPALGQGILLFAGWRMIFAVFIGLSAVVLAWLVLRQPETLAPEHRRPFTLVSIGKGFFEVISNGPAMAYTLVAGAVFGGFMGYLNSCQQIFQVQYGLGKLFPLYFGGLALFIGVAAVVNGQLVMRFGMHRLTRRALYAVTLLSWVLLSLSGWFAGHPPLPAFMVVFVGWFFCMGVVFGNINAMAMEPLGHVAGSAAAVIGTASTLMAVGLGYLIGGAYDGTLLPMAVGFAVLTSIASALTAWYEAPSRRARAARKKL
jgi:DHA1 family bicyclomycin/chloramphenicol resistance-like MFS transporter